MEFGLAANADAAVSHRRPSSPAVSPLGILTRGRRRPRPRRGASWCRRGNMASCAPRASAWRCSSLHAVTNLPCPVATSGCRSKEGVIVFQPAPTPVTNFTVHEDVIPVTPLCLTTSGGDGPGMLMVGVGRLLERLNVRPGACTYGSIRGRAEASYQPVHRQHDADGLRNLQTNRPQLQHDEAAGARLPTGCACPARDLRRSTVMNTPGRVGGRTSYVVAAGSEPSFCPPAQPLARRCRAAVSLSRKPCRFEEGATGAARLASRLFSAASARRSPLRRV